MRITALAATATITALTACTGGAPPAGGSGPARGAATAIDVSLSGLTVVATPYGPSGGFTPALATVALGTTVRFVNVDNAAHTATSLAGPAFPADPHFAASALGASGDRLSTGWSSGTLAPGAASPPLLADATGTYLYGCFFHYGAPMRAAIVVR